jgi:cation transport regulator
MPYNKISDLPESQVDQYDAHQKKAFLEAFNNAERQYHDEHKAFAVAHHAAKEAGKEERG